MSAGLSGVNGNVFVGANDVDMQSWTLDGESKGFDSTTTADLGWEDENSSTRKKSGSFKILYNPAKKPTAVLGLTEGLTVALVLWVVNPGGDKFSGNARIQKMSYDTKVTDGILITCTWTSKGVWVDP